MKKNPGIFRVILLALSLGAVSLFGENLISNGNLEAGSGGVPSGWSRPDGITSLWKAVPGGSGHCVVLNTAVTHEEKQAHLGLSGTADKALVAEVEGAWLFAPPYDVQPGDTGFILSCDVMAPKKSGELSYPMVLIRGFQKQDSGDHSSWFHSHFEDGVYYSEQFGSDAQRRDARPGDYLMVYRHTMACRVEQANCWVHVEMGFSLPKQKAYRPERLLFKLYAYMPPGEYRFDNLTLRRATPEEIRAVNARRPSIRRFTTGKKRQTSEK